jgi:hypothetical protein
MLFVDMENVFKQRTYECECGSLTKQYVWGNDLETTEVKCNNCSEMLDIKNLVKPIVNQAASIRTPTKNR